MSTYIAIPKMRLPTGTYSAPTMFIEAVNHNDALTQVKNSALGRFPEWDFHVAQYQCKYQKGVSFRKAKSNYSKESKSQLGKMYRSMPDSRPIRRQKRRINSKGKNETGSHHKCNSAKAW